LYDYIFSLFAFIYRQKKIPNIISPKSLTEKILTIKLKPNHFNSDLRRLAADRYNVREYVNKNSEECKLIPLLWHGLEFTNEVWNSLPDKFVIKANHGSKMVKIVDKTVDDYDTVSSMVSGWLHLDYYKKGREWVYKDTPRFFVVEQYIEFSGDVPPDFKFFCLNGKVELIQVDFDRFKGHCRSLYSREFELLDVQYEFNRGGAISKPDSLEDAIDIAESLSAEFDFIRVDLYLLEDGIYFGELTNFPGNCLESFEPHSFDIKLGSKLDLSI
jgi:hypothetical protein